MLSKKADSSVVTMPRRIRYKKRIILLIVVGALALLAGGYILYRRQQAGKIPTVVIDGKEVPAPFMTEPFQPDPSDAGAVDYAEIIRRLEEQIANGATGYEYYEALARAYSDSGNKAKAIENYEKAKQAADPDMPYYDSYIASIDEIIKRLKEDG